MSAPARYFIETAGNPILADHFNAELNLIKQNMEPAQFPASYANVAQMQTTADPGELGTESQATSTTGELQRLYHLLKEIKGTTYSYETPTGTIDSVYPVGTILAFFDFNGTVSPGANWAYCDGSTISDASSPLNGKTLPDLSNRYLVGFGTEGGGDIDTATWNATVVGNINHATDLQHTHTDSGHDHSQSHEHDSGSLQFVTAEIVLNKVVQFRLFDSGGTAVVISANIGMEAGASYTSNVVQTAYATYYTTNGTGQTAASTTDTGATSATFGTALASSTDHRPRSVRIRWIMRIK